MKQAVRQSGFTLMELLVVAAIVVVLASALLGVGRRILVRAQEKLARSTIDIIVTAIEQYHNELDRFPIPLDFASNQLLPITSGFTEADLIRRLQDDIKKPVTVTPPGFNGYAVSECLYYFLNQAPASRRIIDTIADSQKTAMVQDATLSLQPRQASYTDAANQTKIITLIRLIDPWGSPLRYEYAPASMSFPLITSAGPDKTFNTQDDLRSDE